MPNPSNSDLVGEARRLGVELRAATFPTDTKSHRAQAAVMIERLAQQLEQADSLAEANKRLNEWYGTAKREAERYREALQIIVDDQAGGINVEMARAALTPDEGADPGGR